MNACERALRFECKGDILCGVLHEPENATEEGVLMVVGGPQYRVGSHRQYVLLARALARAGVGVMRFDPRGMGDSEGTPRDFREMGPDIRSAAEELLRQLPSISRVTIWGLCDGASAALLSAHIAPRTTGLVLVNPWMHSQEAAARSYLKHYYRSRLFEESFWRKLASGEFEFRKSFRSLMETVVSSLGARNGSPGDVRAEDQAEYPPLESHMAEALERFTGKVLVILSGNDLTAAEFKDSVSRSKRWRALMGEARVCRYDLASADHTFSRDDWRDQVARWTIDWIFSRDAPPATGDAARGE